jgi:hypothetical protein
MIPGFATLGEGRNDDDCRDCHKGENHIRSPPGYPRLLTRTDE